LLNRSAALSHVINFMEQVREVAGLLDAGVVERLAQELSQLREREGRLFLLGVGGSAGNCGHAANDFRKLCGIEAYAPTDNVSELTARANDEGWDTIFTGWLRCRLSSATQSPLFSGWRNAARNVSVNLVKAIDLAKQRGARVFAIVVAPTARQAHGDVVVVIPQVDAGRDAASVSGNRLALPVSHPASVADEVVGAKEFGRDAPLFDRDGVRVPQFREGRFAPTTSRNSHLSDAPSCVARLGSGLLHRHRFKPARCGGGRIARDRR
jgi:D-sedoheptulose 7-phosphate isomerase